MNRVKLNKSPSVNHLYAISCTGKYPRVYMTQKGKDWFEDSIYAIKEQTIRRKPIESDVVVHITVKTVRRSDLDNFGKCSLDLLEKANVIKDDKQVVELHMFKEKVKHYKDENMILEWEKI